MRYWDGCCAKRGRCPRDPRRRFVTPTAVEASGDRYAESVSDRSAERWPWDGGEAGALFRARDWSTTSLGPAQDWSQPLRTVVGIVLASARPTAVYWGSEFVFIYNDAMIPILGDKHPEAMGRPGREVFPEVWETIEPLLTSVLATGEALDRQRQYLPLRRAGVIEEAWFDYSFSAIPDGAGSIAGVFNLAVEVTDSMLAERERERADQARRTQALRLERALSIETVAVIFFNSSGEIIEANQAFLNWGDYTQEDIEKRRLRWQELTPPEWMPVSRRALEQLKITGASIPYQKEYLRKDGSRWRGLFAAKMVTEDEAVMFILDVTDVEQAHRALEQAQEEARLREEAARERIEAALQQAPAALCLLSGPDHVFVLANLPYLELIGSRSVVGKTVREAIPEAAAQGFLDLLDRVYETGEPFVGNEHRLELDRGGSSGADTMYVNFVYAPTRGRDGLIDGIFVHVYEVTAQVEARIAAEEAQRTAEEAARAREEFLSIASHELRNPVAALRGTTQFLARARSSGRLTEERLDTYLEALETAGRYLARLTDDLLDVSRVQLGQLPLRIQTTDLAQLVRHSVNRGEWPDHQVVLELQEDFTAAIDPDRIAQVLGNLLDNAVKYSPMTRDIHIRLTREREGALFEVQDHGIGLSAENLESIFTPFNRAPNARDIPGLGLGLYLARRLAEQHGGRLWAESAGEGRGTRFRLWLPLTEDGSAPQ